MTANHFEKASCSVGAKSLAVFVGSEISSKGYQSWCLIPTNFGFMTQKPMIGVVVMIQRYMELTGGLY